MVFGLFKKKDPVCGMKQEKGKGYEVNNMWFCSEGCIKEHEQRKKERTKGSCCAH